MFLDLFYLLIIFGIYLFLLLLWNIILYFRILSIQNWSQKSYFEEEKNNKQTRSCLQGVQIIANNLLSILPEKIYQHSEQDF